MPQSEECPPVEREIRVQVEHKRQWREDLLSWLDNGGDLELVLHRPRSGRRAELRSLGVSSHKRCKRRLAVLRTEGVIRYVRTEQIDWIEGANQYVRLYVEKERLLLRDSLSRLETLLDPSRFLRVHRSAIVNLTRVRELHRTTASCRWAVLENGSRIRVSQGCWDRLVETLEQVP